MSYKGKSLDGAVLTDGTPVAYTAGGVIGKNIPVRGKSNQLSVFVKLSAGTLTHLEVYESIDGSDWRNAKALAAYKSSSLWSVVTFDQNTAATSPSVEYPAGTLLQLRCVTGGVTVDKVLVVQDW